MASYTRSPLLVSPQKSALLLIDFQDKLLNVMSRTEEIIANALKLIDVCKIMGVPILATEQNPERLGPTNEAIQQALADVQPIGKVEFSCFGSDRFRQALDGLGVSQIITAGVESHVCVSQTVLDGLETFDFFVAADAVSSRTEENCALGIDRAGGGGAVIGSTEMFLYELLEKAGTEQFRAALKSLK